MYRAHANDSKKVVMNHLAGPRYESVSWLWYADGFRVVVRSHGNRERKGLG